MNRVLNDLNQDRVEAWLLRIMEPSASEAALEGVGAETEGGAVDDQ
jgi:hypothetical protein